MSTNGNTPINNWFWVFEGGNPSTSSLPNPSNIHYSSPGIYSVSLTVSNTSGQQDTRTINDYINIYEEGNSTNHSLDIWAHNQSYANLNQPVILSVQIISGTPPYSIYVWEPDMGQGLYKKSELNQFTFEYTWKNAGTKNVKYTVVDANGCLGEQSVPISIGFPGSHYADFDLRWTVNYPNNLGTSTQVFFNDKTIGGYKPYYLWIWEYGNGINTGAMPLNSDGKNWEMRYNAWNELDFNGSPLYPVVFDEYDTYPITLIVYDNSGFQIAKTIYVDVSVATKCMKLNPEMVSRFNRKLNKHVIKYEHGKNENIYFLAEHYGYFPWLSSSYSYCKNEYPYKGSSTSGFFPSKSNVFTDTKFTIQSMNFTKSESMPKFYADNQHPVNYQCTGSNRTPNCCNIQTRTPENYYDSWAFSYYNTDNSYVDCYPYFKEPTDISIVFPNPGKYSMRFEAWNRFSEQDNNVFQPQQEPNLEMYDYIDVPLYVVDCGATEFINSSVTSGIYIDKLAGRFEFANSSQVMIENGAEITYQSCNEIIMHQGFTAQTGSNFLTQITDMERDTDSDLREKHLLNIDYMQSETEAYFECYPNPSNGVFRVKHMGNLKIKNIQLLTITGQSCRFIPTEFEMETVIQIINPSTGVYFARFLLDSGELIVKKIIITRF